MDTYILTYTFKCAYLSQTNAISNIENGRISQGHGPCVVHTHSAVPRMPNPAVGHTVCAAI